MSHREKQKLELNLSQTNQAVCEYESVLPAAYKDPRLESQYESVNVTSKDNPAIEDNPAYCTSGGPPLSDNPAYIAMKSDPVTTAVSHHSSN